MGSMAVPSPAADVSLGADVSPGGGFNFDKEFDSAVGVDTSADTASDVAGEVPAEVDSPAEETTEDGEAPAGDSEEVEEEVPAEEPVEEEAPVAEVADEASEKGGDPGDLPEGVRLRTVDGKKAWVMPPEVGQQMLSHVRVLARAEEILGEPLTEDALQYRNDLMRGHEGLRTDLMSPRSEDQVEVGRFLLQQIAAARKAGEVTHDPTPGFVQGVIDQAREVSPDSWPKIEELMFQRAVEAAYQEAALVKPEDREKMWAAVQWVDNLFFGKYRQKAEMASLMHQPGSRFQRKPEPKPAETITQPAGAPLEEFRQQVRDTLRGALNQKIDGVFSEKINGQSIVDRYKAFPDHAKWTRDQIIAAVRKDVLGDRGLKDKVELLDQRAASAAPHFQKQIQQQIVDLHVSAIERAIQRHKGPVLTKSAQMMGAKSTNTQQRTAAAKAAARTTTNAAGGTVKKSIAKTDQPKVFTSQDQLMREMDKWLG